MSATKASETKTKEMLTPPATYRVFVSSTYIDMLPYREAIRTAINKADCIATGMERFGATSIPPIETCLEELAKSQIYVCALGMRYGTEDSKTGKSYTQLEYEKARELGLPTLVFLVDENKVKFNLSEIDMDESGKKLAAFKSKIRESKEVTCAFFDSPISLQEAVFRSLDGEMKRRRIGTEQKVPVVPDDAYIQGAKVYRNFVRLPKLYNNKLITLRVRMDGLFGGWRIRDDLFEAFGMQQGESLLMNDLWILGIDNTDVDVESWSIDCFASAKMVDWLDSNKITQGTIFEGRFLAVYRSVPGISEQKDNSKPHDTRIAALILQEGLRVVNQDMFHT